MLWEVLGSWIDSWWAFFGSVQWSPHFSVICCECPLHLCCLEACMWLTCCVCLHATGMAAQHLYLGTSCWISHFCSRDSKQSLTFPRLLKMPGTGLTCGVKHRAPVLEVQNSSDSKHSINWSADAEYGKLPVTAGWATAGGWGFTQPCLRTGNRSALCEMMVRATGELLQG